MKKLIILLAAVFIAAAFSGCSTLETDTEALMQPPSLTEEQAKLNDALKSVIGDSFVLFCLCFVIAVSSAAVIKKIKKRSKSA